ncbi:hypothetical protein C8Q77DRAFT_881428 [Trametes polyzona]|nr:hypothetical protein C8Q77DRAFT_881428 [Trametes polyzona]
MFPPCYHLPVLHTRTRTSSRLGRSTSFAYARLPVRYTRGGSHAPHVRQTSGSRKESLPKALGDHAGAPVLVLRPILSDQIAVKRARSRTRYWQSYESSSLEPRQDGTSTNHNADREASSLLCPITVQRRSAKWYELSTHAVMEIPRGGRHPLPVPATGRESHPLLFPLAQDIHSLRQCPASRRRWARLLSSVPPLCATQHLAPLGA